MVNVAVGHLNYKKWFQEIFSKNIRLQSLCLIKIY